MLWLLCNQKKIDAVTIENLLYPKGNIATLG